MLKERPGAGRALEKRLEWALGGTPERQRPPVFRSASTMSGVLSDRTDGAMAFRRAPPSSSRPPGHPARAPRGRHCKVVLHRLRQSRPAPVDGRRPSSSWDVPSLMAPPPLSGGRAGRRKASPAPPEMLEIQHLQDVPRPRPSGRAEPRGRTPHPDPPGVAGPHGGLRKSSCQAVPLRGPRLSRSGCRMSWGSVKGLAGVRPDARLSSALVCRRGRSLLERHDAGQAGAGVAESPPCPKRVGRLASAFCVEERSSRLWNSLYA